MQSSSPKQYDGPDHDVIPECEVLWEGGPGPEILAVKCTKNPGHAAFVSVGDLTVDSLPAEYQTQEDLDGIRNFCNRTVKVIVKSTSPDRPDTWPSSEKKYPYSNLKGSDNATRVGTGCIWRIGTKRGRCPCHHCRDSETMEEVDYMEVVVATATHVIYDDSEATTAVFECYYDSADRVGVKCLYGIGMYKTYTRDKLEKYRRDKSHVKCVTHDKEFMVKLESEMERVLSIPSGLSFIVSHPHGMSKKLTFGDLIHHTVKNKGKYPSGIPHKLTQLFYDDTNDSKSLTCRLPVTSRVDQHNLIRDVVECNDPTSSQSARGSIVNNCEEEDCNKSSCILAPGVELEIPASTTVTIPENAEYFCRCREYGKDRWVVFHPGARLTLPDGRLLPPETEFKTVNSDVPGLYGTERCMNYHIPTCPGSSGAMVVVGGDYQARHLYYMLGSPHCGAKPDGSNQSTYGCWW